MFKQLIYASLLFALPGIQAIPTVEQRHYDCISDHEAKKLLEQFYSLFEHIDIPVAKKILTPDFSLQSSSLNFLFGKQDGGPIVTTVDEFIALCQQIQANNPPQKFTILDADHTCNKIYFRWQDNAQPFNLFGFDEMILVKTEKGWQVKKDYSEFNTGLVLFDAGLFPCNANNTPTPGTA